jgi:hypothetical protein
MRDPVMVELDRWLDDVDRRERAAEIEEEDRIAREEYEAWSDAQADARRDAAMEARWEAERDAGVAS